VCEVFIVCENECVWVHNFVCECVCVCVRVYVYVYVCVCVCVSECVAVVLERC